MKGILNTPSSSGAEDLTQINPEYIGTRDSSNPGWRVKIDVKLPDVPGSSFMLSGYMEIVTGLFESRFGGNNDTGPLEFAKV